MRTRRKLALSVMATLVAASPLRAHHGGRSIEPGRSP